VVASDLTIPAHGGLPVFSTLRTPPEESTPTKEGKNQLGGCLGNKAAQRLR